MSDARIACLYLPGAFPPAQAALLELAWSLAPVVAATDGEVLLPLRGLMWRHATEEQLGEHLLQAAAKAGLRLRVGIGSPPLVAKLAARTARPLRVVAPGREREFLRPFPLQVLGASERALKKLKRLGICTVGQLADLPPAGMRLRLGKEGLRLSRLARGEEEGPLLVSPPPESFREEQSLEYPLAQMEPLLQVIGILAERLCQRLRGRGWGVAGLLLQLGLEPAGRYQQALPLASPRPQPKSWLAILRPLLEKTPPPAPVLSVALQAEICRLRPEQAELFEQARPPPAELEETLQRLQALAGEGRLGSPHPADSHLPGDFRLLPFEWRAPSRSPLPPSLRPGRWRALRPPRAVRVECRGGRLVHLKPPAGGLPPGGPVVRCAGPWRAEGGWWEDDSFFRDCYLVEVESGVLWRLFFDRRQSAWFADGVLGTWPPKATPWACGSPPLPSRKGGTRE